MKKTLDMVKKGRRARVRGLCAKGKLLHKLLDMGFVNNVEIEVIREAPLFDPMELKIHNYHLSVRRSEAHLIEIEEQE
ncbi:MAG: ferrous iron transport protein A [Campylobacterales bacterium]|nr:ferrous iron transport protein A [Campylobacterales bacterium]